MPLTQHLDELDTATLRQRLQWLHMRRARIEADVTHYQARLEDIKAEITQTEITLIHRVGPFVRTRQS